MAKPLDVAAGIAAAARQAGRDDPDVRRADVQSGTVTAVGVTAGTVDVGSIRARRLESYLSPTVGDQVLLVQSGTGNWWAAGRIAGAAVPLGVPRHVYKTSPTDRPSTITLADDPDLTMLLPSNSTSLVEFSLFIGGPASGLMVTQWTTPADASGLKGIQGPGSAATDSAADNISGRFGSHGFGTSITYGRRNANTNLLYAVETGIVTTVTGGTCAIAWAQSLSNATATRMGVSSWMRVTRLS